MSQCCSLTFPLRISKSGMLDFSNWSFGFGWLEMSAGLCWYDIPAQRPLGQFSISFYIACSLTDKTCLQIFIWGWAHSSNDWGQFKRAFIDVTPGNKKEGQSKKWTKWTQFGVLDFSCQVCDLYNWNFLICHIAAIWLRCAEKLEFSIIVTVSHIQGSLTS